MTHDPKSPFYMPLPAPPAFEVDPSWNVPDDEQCFRWWEEYEMLDNIREHSLKVASVATAVARCGAEVGMNVDVPTVRASALLHDITKTYCIHFGGHHSQSGGALVAELTGNPVLASGVTHHVYWPFVIDLGKYFTPIAVLYADKRVSHDAIVNIGDRFDDLIERYGRSDLIKSRIRETFDQAEKIEDMLSQALKVNLNECTFDSGRLV